jgi:hypothetical protein
MTWALMPARWLHSGDTARIAGVSWPVTVTNVEESFLPHIGIVEYTEHRDDTDRIGSALLREDDYVRVPVTDRSIEDVGPGDRIVAQCVGDGVTLVAAVSGMTGFEGVFTVLLDGDSQVRIKSADAVVQVVEPRRPATEVF